MFNKSDVKNFIEKEQKEYYQKVIKNKVDIEEVNALAGAFENKTNKIYRNMSETIDNGLKKSISDITKLTNDKRINFSAKVSFFIRNISGLKAFVRIINEYSSEYDVVFKSSNIAVQSNPLNSLDKIKKLAMFNQDASLSNEILAEIYRNEDILTKKILFELYGVDSIQLQIDFISKWTIEELFESEKENNCESKIEDDFDNFTNYFLKIFDIPSSYLKKYNSDHYKHHYFNRK